MKTLTEKQIKRLKEISRKILKFSAEIDKMGLLVYLNSSGLSLMDKEKHLTKVTDNPDCRNEIFNIPVTGWDGGDW